MLHCVQILRFGLLLQILQGNQTLAGSFYWQSLNGVPFSYSIQMFGVRICTCGCFDVDIYLQMAVGCAHLWPSVLGKYMNIWGD